MKLWKSETFFKIIPELAIGALKIQNCKHLKLKHSDRLRMWALQQSWNIVAQCQWWPTMWSADVDDGCHSHDCSVDVKIPTADHFHDCTDPPSRSEPRLSSSSPVGSPSHSSKLRAGCFGSRWTSWRSCRPWGWGRSQGSCWIGPSGPFSSSPPPPSSLPPDLAALRPLPSWTPLWATSFGQKHVRSGKLGTEKIPCQHGYYLDISSFMGAKDIFGIVPPECRVDDDVYSSLVLISLSKRLNKLKY